MGAAGAVNIIFRGLDEGKTEAEVGWRPLLRLPGGGSDEGEGGGGL